MKKYVVCPGNIVSRNDGDTHYIGPYQLMRLYGVDPNECEIYEPALWWSESYYKMEEKRYQGMIKLKPRYDGNYLLPDT